jgi:periplasmic protein TonB
MTWLSAQDRRDLIRWLACGVVVVFAHAGVAAGLIDWSAPVEEGEVGADAIVVEFQQEQLPTDPVPEVQKIEEKPEPLPEQQSEAMLPPQPKPEEQPVPHEQMLQVVRQDAHAVATVATWRSQIITLLEHNKRYPAEASARGEHGTTMLEFSVDGDGHLLSSHVVKSSGSVSLDQETLALMHRVEPFPHPPPEMVGHDLIVPLRYMFR